VDENYVEVAERTELTAPVAADSYQRYAARVVTRSRREKVGQPFVGGRSESVAKSFTLQVGSFEQGLA
jgi:hypothetical protein